MIPLRSQVETHAIVFFFFGTLWKFFSFYAEEERRFFFLRFMLFVTRLKYTTQHTFATIKICGDFIIIIIIYYYYFCFCSIFYF